MPYGGISRKPVLKTKAKPYGPSTRKPPRISEWGPVPNPQLNTYNNYLMREINQGNFVPTPPVYSDSRPWQNPRNWMSGTNTSRPMYSYPMFQWRPQGTPLQPPSTPSYRIHSWGRRF